MLKNEHGDNVWRPTIKQERFLQIPLSIKEGFYAGAVGAGKSDVLLMYPIVHEWYKHPNFKGVFLRRTTPELKNEIIPRAKNYFRPYKASFNATDGIFTFPSGAIFKMGHCEHEDDVHDYDSMEINYLAIDELTSFTEFIYTYLMIQRVRVPEYLKHELPMIVRAASNPGNIGHQFVYKRFVKPYPSGGKILIGRGNVKRIFIPATINDNPHVSQQYKDDLEALPEAERKAKKGGDWTAYEGQVFDELRDKKYPDEPDNALHLIAPFDIPAWWPRICAIDWGFSAMCSIGWGAISPTKRLYVYRHQMFYGKKIEEWAPEIKFHVDRDKPKDIVICHSANQHRGDPHTILEQVTEALGVSVRLGEKDRVGGKLLLHEMLRWQKKPIPQLEQLVFDVELSTWILRNKGIYDYQEYMKCFEPSNEETNIPVIQFFDNPEKDVQVIIEALKACVYEKSGADGKKKEDVAEFNGDDPYDMLRMLAHAADSFFALAVDEQAKMERVQSVISEYGRNKDMTKFYMQMRHLEVRDKVVPVKVFHPRRIH